MPALRVKFCVVVKADQVTFGEPFAILTLVCAVHPKGSAAGVELLCPEKAAIPFKIERFSSREGFEFLRGDDGFPCGLRLCCRDEEHRQAGR